MKTFKFRIETDENGELTGISVSNKQIHAGLFSLLNHVCHETLNKFNGKLGWYETFIRFEHKGKEYTQIRSKNLCAGCCFMTNIRCLHPFFITKPYCNGKIYIEEVKNNNNESIKILQH